MNRQLLIFAALLIGFALQFSAFPQKVSALGRVCGNPTLPCKTRENFQLFELPFDYGKSVAIARSQQFYAVILKSVKLNADQSNCSDAISESERSDAQALFPRNMVFVMRCWESGQNSYTNVADSVSFMAVYAGPTLTIANALLKKVQATGKFNSAIPRRMRAKINGT